MQDGHQRRPCGVVLEDTTHNPQTDQIHCDGKRRKLMSDFVGAVKIKDGLFLGDELGAQDLEFAVANKVSVIINCSGRHVPNHWESIGILYRTFNWSDNDSQVILDVRDNVVNDAFPVIDNALDNGESVLIHSARGQSRSVTLLAAYLMKKFNWSYTKTIQFITTRRSDINMKPAFHRQLLGFEKRLASHVASKFERQPLSKDWTESTSLEDEVMKNTYNNAKVGNSHIKELPFVPAIGSRPPARRLIWNEQEFSENENSRKQLPLRPILKREFVPRPAMHAPQAPQQENCIPSPFKSRMADFIRPPSPAPRLFGSGAVRGPVRPLSARPPRVTDSHAPQRPLFVRPPTPVHRPLVQNALGAHRTADAPIAFMKR